MMFGMEIQEKEVPYTPTGTIEDRIAITQKFTEMYKNIPDELIRSTLIHQGDTPVEHYIKVFTDNNFINKDKDKDTEDVIRAYWNLQDTRKNQGYLVNAFQQRALKFLHDNPDLIKKLYRCRSKFALQQKKFTESVQAIVKFGRYYMFTTEYDTDIVPPCFSHVGSWGTISGLYAKQLCIVIADANTTFIKSMASQDDKKYALGIIELFSSMATADKVKMISAQNPMFPGIIMPEIGLIKGYNNIQSTANQAVDNKRKKENDRYNVIYGDPFNITSSFSGLASGLMTTYTGIINKYGLMDFYCFEIDRYKDYIDYYITDSRLQQDNPQLYSYTWNRFEKFYHKLLRSMVDRAIISAHQTMVDYLISIHESSYTFIQLGFFYSPGTMIDINTEYNVNQCSMILGQNLSNNNGSTALDFQVLNLNTTKIPNILVHDAIISGSVNELVKSKASYSTALIEAPNRGNSIFNYFSLNSNIKLLTDNEVEKQLDYNKEFLNIIVEPKHMEMDNNYFYRDWRANRPMDLQTRPYRGRLVVDLDHSRSSWSDSNYNPGQYAITIPFTEVYKQISLEYFKQKPYTPGLPFSYNNSMVSAENGNKNKRGFGYGYQPQSTPNNNNIIITSNQFLDDIRFILSLPVVASTYMLQDKRWGMARISDLKEPHYDEDILDKLVFDPDIKNFMYKVAKGYNKNTFKDVIANKQGGTIFLLVSTAGRGKSASAEAMAEKLKRPLYQVSAGELGDNSWDMENNLKKILSNSERWNAVVLIDEADVFLAKRKDNNLRRNTVVSVFLRQLEYFNGVMFLTSNRAEDIDPAFESRIVQTFVLPPLTDNELARIWKLLAEYQGLTLTDKEADELSKYTTNGRDVKNCIKVSLTMAAEAKKPLSYHILKENAEFMYQHTPKELPSIEDIEVEVKEPVTYRKRK